MSMVCSISTRQSDEFRTHTGRISIAIDCHAESNNLWPSNKLDIPALPLHGKSFRNGVRFSVQTISLGRVPCRSWRRESEALEWWPSGSNVNTGRMVRVESMKFKEAQKRPDKALVKRSQRKSALSRL